MEDKTIIMEEYKIMRNEISTLVSRRSQRLTITYTCVAALISVTYFRAVPEISPLAMLLVGAAWHDDHKQREQILRVGEYVKLFIESKVDELNWEKIYGLMINSENKNASHNIKLLDWLKKFKKIQTTISLASCIKKSAFSNYGSLGLISVAYSVFSVFQRYPANNSSLAAFIAAFIIGSYPLYTAFRRGMKYSDFSKNNKDRCMKIYNESRQVEPNSSNHS